jgi:predicted nuclease with TOPRIM domain
MPLQIQLTNMHEEMMLMRESMQEIAKALTRLAVLEEKHNITVLKCDKLELEFDELKDAVQLNEKNAAVRIAKFDGMKTAMGFMWAAFGSGALYLAWQVVMFIAKTVPA